MFKSRPKKQSTRLRNVRLNSQSIKLNRSLSPFSQSPASSNFDIDSIARPDDEYNRVTRHAILLKKMNNKRSLMYKSVKASKSRNQRLLKSRKKKILEDNRRKMLEIQWRVRLAKLSTDMHKQKIKNIGWKINKWYDGKDGAKYRTVDHRTPKRFD
jgi:hypothetical protein